VDSVYTDFSKAFDRVPHQLLLEGMSVCIEPVRCLWLRFYLTERIQRIRIGDAVSNDIRVTSGVPQGSHLRPFIRFVNRIQLGGTVLDRISSINDLGVIMDEKLLFSEHIDVMVDKVLAMLGFIRDLFWIHLKRLIIIFDSVFF
jgi:hypothetical protein